MLFEPLWNAHAIDHVQITVGETVGLEGRVSYYDGVGALRDMVQNHVLQILSIIAMEPPARFDSTSVRDEKVKVLRSLRPFSGEMAKTQSVRGQYTNGAVGGEIVKGYAEELGETSDTETFVALKAYVDNWRWAGVPFYLRTGKRMPRRHSDIVIQFKPRRSPFCGEVLAGNKIVVTIQPDAWIMFFFKHKVPGLTMGIKEVDQCFFREESFVESPREGYQRIFYEIIQGNRLLFTTPHEVIASWIFVDRLIAAAREAGIDPVSYEPGVEDLPESAAMLERAGYSWYEAWYTRSCPLGGGD